MRRRLPILVCLLISLPLVAEVPAGRELVLLRHGRWLAPDGRVTPAIAHASAAFDGERFLIALPDGGVHLALLDEGAAEPRVTLTLSDTGDNPTIRWDGTRYVVLWNAGSFVRGAFVSPQGVVERTFVLPLIARFSGFTAGANGIAIVGHGETETHFTLDLTLLDTEQRARKTTRLGSIQKSSGFGSTFHGNASIMPFGSGFYAVWTAGRSGRMNSVVGTRITGDGEALDLGPYPHEGNSIEGRVLDAQYGGSLVTVQVQPFGDRVVVLISWDGSGPAAAWVRPDGTHTIMRLHIRGWIDWTRLPDGTIALILQSPWPEYRLSLQPFLRTPEPTAGRRRSSRR
ncbi:MAG TPA: hypothetical protein VGF48_06945 [Thermoanaerobaculia bacterium]|jgi:hypothetical protein